MGGTVVRQHGKKGPGKAAKLEDVVRHRSEGCGVWYFSYLPEGPAPKMVKGYFDKGKGSRKRRYVRWSFDNLIYFFPNPENNCKTYAFMQFVKRTGRRITFKDGGYKEGAILKSWTHDWRPDLEDWEKRKPGGFIDPDELIYKLQSRTSKDGQKKTRTHGAAGMVRRDGPGYAYPVGTKAPASFKLSYKFRVYAVCDVKTDLKVLGYVEYGFDIIVDKHGRPTLEFKDNKNIWKNFSVTTICCKKSKEFEAWINQWRLFLWMGPPVWQEMKKWIKSKKKTAGPPKDSIIRLEDTGRIIDNSVKSRNKPLKFR